MNNPLPFHGLPFDKEEYPHVPQGNKQSLPFEKGSLKKKKSQKKKKKLTHVFIRYISLKRRESFKSLYNSILKIL